MKQVSLDLWIIDHFKVLPTEDRFTKLTETQKYLMFLGFVEHPLPEAMHRWYNSREQSESVITEEDAKNFKGLGYTDDQIVRMRDQLAIANAELGKRGGQV